MVTTPSPGERFELLYRLSQTFNSSLNLSDVLKRVMDEVIAAVQAERGFVMLFDEQGELAFQVARGMDRMVIEDPQFQVSLSIVERVAHSGNPVLTSDAQTDERFSMRTSVMLLGLRSILCVPLQIKDKTLGVIYVDNRMQVGLFTQRDLELLSAIASNAAIAIENARLYQLAVEKGRLERELQMARQVQTSLLPTQVPEYPGWELIARWRPARSVAGDYYDFIPLRSGELGLVIADVSDKGMPAALFMAITRSIIRASMDRAATPVDGILQANRLISADASEGMFVTLFYAQLNLSTGELTYVNAGHNPPLHIQKNHFNTKVSFTTLRRTGMALGVVNDTAYEQDRLIIEPGDLLIMYTDGVTDALNQQGEIFGLDRLRRVMIENVGLKAQEIIARIEHSMTEFSESTEPFDDVTMILIQRQ